MKIEPDPAYGKRVLNSLRERLGVGGQRRPGVHVSELVFCLRKAWHERRRPELLTSDSTVLTWARGLSHEALFATSDATQVVYGHCFTCGHKVRDHSGDVESEACPVCGSEMLFGTIDWIDDGIAVEAKSTMKSSKATLHDMLWYADQALSYAWLAEMPEARVVVFHVMGDWKPGTPEPVLATYKVSFESEEERARWGETLKRRYAVVLQDREPALGPEAPVYDWMCSYCKIVTCEKNPANLEHLGRRRT